MAKEESMSEFERLLQERQQIEHWLEKLAASGDKTPASVRDRVEADYQKRLDEVQEELNGHRDEITGALDRHRQVRDELLKQQADAKERRSEAELRHTVGEFSDSKWDGIRTEIDESLKKIGDELEGVDAEISDLEKALASITSGPEATSEPSIPDAEEKPAKPEDLPPPIREAETAAAKPKAKPEPVAETKAEAPEDGLELLDVAAEEEPERTSEAVPMPPDAAELLGKKETEKETAPAGAGSAVGADGVTSFSNNTEQPKKGAAKTLKCGECGAMNLPTEWYCERCGAELAAL